MDVQVICLVGHQICAGTIQLAEGCIAQGQRMPALKPFTQAHPT